MATIVETVAGGFDRNLCYVLGCPETREAALVDAGVDLDPVFASLARHGLRPTTLLVTHSHGDHLSEGLELVRRTRVAVHAFDPAVRPRVGATDFRPLVDGGEVQVGRLRVEVLHTPGHSPDSACFRAGELLFTGDTLFVGRTGRTVATHSSTRDLFRSVQRLKQLPASTVVLPGHDYGSSPSSTIGRELAENDWMRAETEQEFVRVMERYEQGRRRS